MRLNLAWSNIFCSLAVCLVLWKWFVAGPASDSHHLSLIASGGDVLWMCYRGTAWHYPWAALGKGAVAVFLERTALLRVPGMGINEVGL